MPGSGDFVSFFRPGGRSFSLKSCLGAGILTEKISGPGSARGRMVTGQTDTCITHDFRIWGIWGYIKSDTGFIKNLRTGNILRLIVPEKSKSILLGERLETCLSFGLKKQKYYK